jgi:crotonobetainyl-CoA:carnitine CoA-transferase CaiB-like acyl-CoA transferase
VSPPAHPGQHSAEILRDWGFDAARIEMLIASQAVVTG